MNSSGTGGEEQFRRAGKVAEAAAFEFLPACPAAGAPKIMVVQNKCRAGFFREVENLLTEHGISGQSRILKPNQRACGVAALHRS